jgi:hypothetical protein
MEAAEQAQNLRVGVGGSPARRRRRLPERGRIEGSPGARRSALAAAAHGGRGGGSSRWQRRGIGRKKKIR